MLYENYLFDFDGTIVESAPDIIMYLEKAFEELSFEHLPIIRSYIGPPLDQLIRNLSPNLNDGQVDTVVNLFRSYYNQNSLSQTVLKLGVKEVIQTLKGLDKKLFVVTNKPRIPTLKIMKQLNLIDFSDVYCCDSLTVNKQKVVTKKLKLIEHLVNKWSINISNTVMVGDTSSDVTAAKPLGIDTIYLKDGYGTDQQIVDSCPTYVIENMRQLLIIKNTN